MNYRRPLSPLQKTLHKVALVMLGLFCFLTENITLTKASSFEVATVKKKLNRRLPANLAQQVFNFDCASPHEYTEHSTPFETIRLVVKNCQQNPELKNSKLNIKLHTFAVNKTHYSSEFAYLARGENKFSIYSNNKEYKISIFRH